MAARPTSAKIRALEATCGHSGVIVRFRRVLGGRPGFPSPAGREEVLLICRRTIGNQVAGVHREAQAAELADDSGARFQVKSGDVVVCYVG